MSARTTKRFMLTSTFIAASLIAVSAMPAKAAVLNGTFSVKAINVTDLNSSQSEATRTNFDAADGGTLGGIGSSHVEDIFTYTGDLDFRVPGPQSATQTIGNWLATGTGSVSGIDAAFESLQLSTASVNNGTATSTFFLFDLTSSLGATEFSITHDDGVAVFDDGAFIGGDPGPTDETTTLVTGFDGGDFELLYVATNGNPSILEVDATPVPLPATLPMLLGALGIAGLAARRRKAA